MTELLKPGTLRVTSLGPNGIVNCDYSGAKETVSPPWLVVTHQDQSGQKLLSRIPLANVIQVVEVVPELS